MHSSAEYGGAKLGQLKCLCLHVAISTAEQKRMCWCFTRRVIPILFHISSREQTAPRNINPALSWPQKAGAKWGQEVNPGLALNRRAVIVGSSESVKRPGSVRVGVGPRKGQRGLVVIWAMRRRWGGEGGPPCTSSGSCLQKQPCTDISQNSWLCYYCVLLCARRWIGSAFRLTKSLGMHTGAGSGNSNTALSWAVKEDNASCPLWTGLVSAQIPIFCRETLPASHFTERTFLLFIHFFSFTRMAYIGMSAYLFQHCELQWESVTITVAVSSL